MFYTKSKGSMIYNLIYAAAMIALGAFVIARPELLISVIIKVIGACALVVGLVTLIRYFTSGRAQGETPLNVLTGGVMVVAGAIFFLYPLQLTALIFIVLGIILLVKGINAVSAAWSVRRAGLCGWGYLMASAVVTLLLGILMLANPLLAPSALFYVMGAALIFEGASTLAAYFIFRSREGKINDVDEN